MDLTHVHPVYGATHLPRHAGQAHKKGRQVHVRHAQAFVPPTIHYNPFNQPVIVEPSERAPKQSPQATATSCPATPHLPSKSTFTAVRNLQATTKAMAPPPSVRPPSVDSNLSDWTDCDMIEFETMGVSCYTCCGTCYAAAGCICAHLLMPMQSNAPVDPCCPWHLRASGTQKRWPFGHAFGHRPCTVWIAINAACFILDARCSMPWPGTPAASNHDKEPHIPLVHAGQAEHA